MAKKESERRKEGAPIVKNKTKRKKLNTKEPGPVRKFNSNEQSRLHDMVIHKGA